MRSTESLLPGVTAGRWLRSLAVAKGDMNGAIGYAMGKQATWQASTPSLYSAMREWPDLVMKISTDPMNTSNSSALFLPSPIRDDFMGLVRGASALAGLRNTRKFPPNSAIVGFTSGASASIVDEFAPIPLSEAALATTVLVPKKVAGMTVISVEVALGQTSDKAIANDLARAVALASDIAALDPNAPFSISNGASSFASSGSSLANIDTDLARAINTLAAGTPDQSLASASWIMSTEGATYLSTLRGTAGSPAYPGVTALGGELLGLPVLTTAGVASGTSPQAGAVLLVDGSQIAQNSNNDIGLEASQQASLVMDSAPPSGAQQSVSMFQTNSVCLLALRWLAVARQQTSSVVAITACSWA